MMGAAGSALRGSVLYRAHMLGLMTAVVFASCATPVPPSGGPPDDVPPEVVETVPAAGELEVDASRNTIRIVFSEYVEPSSFAQAFSLTPSFDQPLEFEWRGRAVDIELPDSLRDNTTYLITLDTNLRDIRSVDLTTPVTLAFSTGPTISRGTLTGNVMDPRTGAGAAGVDVYAYAFPDSTLPDSLPGRPAYRTQTDETGMFRFEYLTEQPYYVLALRDLNRNRDHDATEAFAVPPQPLLIADSTGASPETPWLLTRRDTLPPEPQRVRPLSQRRFVVRFTEPVRFLAGAADAWTLYDSLAARRIPVEALFQLQGDAQQIYATTEVLEPRPHGIVTAAVVDTAGNRVQRETLSFTPSTAVDTFLTRFQTFTPDTLSPQADDVYVLPPRTRAGVRFNQPVDSLELRRMVRAIDSTGQALSYTASTNDGITYRLQPVPPLKPGEHLRVSVSAEPDTTFTRTFRRISGDELGEMSGMVEADTAAVVVQLFPAEPPVAEVLREVAADTSGRFLFDDLPQGQYRLRAFVDRDGDRQWDGGRILPYVRPESLLWVTEPERVRPRWETALADTLRF